MAFSLKFTKCIGLLVKRLFKPSIHNRPISHVSCIKQINIWSCLYPSLFHVPVNANYRSVLIYKKFGQIQPSPFNYNVPKFLFGFAIGLFSNPPSRWANERKVIAKIESAKTAINNGELEKATKILEQALRLAENSGTKIGVPCIYDMLATIAYNERKFGQAEQLLIKGKEVLLAMGLSEYENLVINFSLKLARLYAILGLNDMANIEFDNCFRYQSRKLTSYYCDEESRMLFVSILFWYGKFLFNQGTFEEANIMFESAYSKSCLLKTILPSQLMVILYNLAATCYAREDFNGALKYLTNAIIIGKDSNNPDLPLFFVKIGIVHMFKGAFNEARNWCYRGYRTGKANNNEEAVKESLFCMRSLRGMKEV